jgi:hypothetical protein
METWGSRVVTAVLGVAGGALVLAAAWLLADVARFEGPAGLQVALALVCAPIVVWLAVTSEVPALLRRRVGVARRRA